MYQEETIFELKYVELEFSMHQEETIFVNHMSRSWVDLLFVNMVLKLKLLNEKVEKDLELENL